MMKTTTSNSMRVKARRDASDIAGALSILDFRF